MKKEYTNPKIEITTFEANDVISLSSVTLQEISSTKGDITNYLHS